MIRFIYQLTGSDNHDLTPGFKLLCFYLRILRTSIVVILMDYTTFLCDVKCILFIYKVSGLVWIISRELQWCTTITNPTEGARDLTQLACFCRLLRILDVCKMRNVLRNVLQNACLNNSTIRNLTQLNMATVWHVRQCEGIICIFMYMFSRWNADWWPDDRCAGSMPERSPYASYVIWKHNVYIIVYIQSTERRGKFDWIQCQDGIVLAVLSIEHTYEMSTHSNYRWLCACTVNSLPFMYIKRYFTI